MISQEDIWVEKILNYIKDPKNNDKPEIKFVSTK